MMERREDRQIDTTSVIEKMRSSQTHLAAGRRRCTCYGIQDGTLGNNRCVCLCEQYMWPHNTRAPISLHMNRFDRMKGHIFSDFLLSISVPNEIDNS